MKSGVVESLAIWEVARAAASKAHDRGMPREAFSDAFSTHFAAGLGGFAYVDLDTPMFMADHRSPAASSTWRQAQRRPRHGRARSPDRLGTREKKIGHLGLPSQRARARPADVS